jgi:molybdenum cofactor cytidylyltransferase
MIDGPSRISAVILAAGSGSRMGGVAKALLEGRGKRTFLTSILETAREVGVHEAIVVVGPPYGDVVAAHARALGARTVENPHPERGMASSVALGFGAVIGIPREGSAAARPTDASEAPMFGEADAAWLWPVDHPHVEARTLRTLIAALGPHAAVRPVFEGRRGHPPLVTRALFAELADCAKLEGGARTVLAGADTIDVPVDDPGTVRDIDTPLDLEAR